MDLQLFFEKSDVDQVDVRRRDDRPPLMYATVQDEKLIRAASAKLA